MIGEGVIVRRDMADASCLHVFSKTADSGYQFVCTATTALFGGKTVEEYKHAVNSHKKALRERKKAIETAMERVPDLYERLNKAEIVDINTGEGFENEAVKQAEHAQKSSPATVKKLSRATAKSKANNNKNKGNPNNKNNYRSEQAHLVADCRADGPAQVISLENAMSNSSTMNIESDFELVNKGMDKLYGKDKT